MEESHELQQTESANSRSTETAELEEPINRRTQDIDKGWAWIVMTSVFFISINHGGILYTTGKFYIYFMTAFGKSKSETALVSALYAASEYCFSIFSSIIANKFGHRATVMIGAVICASGFFISAFSTNIIGLYLTAGILAGCGMSMVYSQGIPVLSFYFRKYRALATSVCLTGSAVGLIIYSYMIDFLVDFFGWRGTLMIISGIVLNCTVCGALLRPVEGYASEKQSGKLLDISIFKDIRCIFFLGGQMFWSIMITTPWIIIPVHSKGCGTGGNPLSLVGLSSIFGRLLFSVVGFQKTINQFLILALITFINGFPVLGIISTCDTLTILGLTCVLGFCMGYQYTAVTFLCTDVFGLNRITSGFGVLLCFDGITWLCGPPFAGFMYDVTGSYMDVSIMGVIVSILSAACFVFIWWHKRTFKPKSKSQTLLST